MDGSAREAAACRCRRTASQSEEFRGPHSESIPWCRDSRSGTALARRQPASRTAHRGPSVSIQNSSPDFGRRDGHCEWTQSTDGMKLWLRTSGSKPQAVLGRLSVRDHPSLCHRPKSSPTSSFTERAPQSTGPCWVSLVPSALPAQNTPARFSRRRV